MGTDLGTRSRIGALRDDSEKNVRSRPSTFVPEHGPVLRRAEERLEEPWLVISEWWRAGRAVRCPASRTVDPSFESSSLPTSHVEKISAYSRTIRSLIRPCQIFFTPGNPSLFRPRKPPILPSMYMISLTVGGSSGRGFFVLLLAIL